VALWPDGDKEAVSLDLHSEPFLGTLFRVDESALLEHLVDTSFHERTVKTFDRPLSLIHMVAHFLQHRMERSHLQEIGAAWDAWSLDEGELRALARRTCSEPALEHALWLARRAGACVKVPLVRQSVRARLIGAWDRPNQREPAPTAGRVISILLAQPLRLPAAAARGLLLEPDDLESRFGGGSRLGQIGQRANELLTRG
jgi:hypothetical protein